MHHCQIWLCIIVLGCSVRNAMSFMVATMCVELHALLHESDLSHSCDVEHFMQNATSLKITSVPLLRFCVVSYSPR